MTRLSSLERVRALRVVGLALLALFASTPVHAAPISAGCLPNPLPAPPPSPAAALDTATNFGEAMHVQVWRQACRDGTGTAVLLHASATSAAPLLCSGDWALLQGGLQHNAVLLPAPGSARLCADLISATTVILDAAEGSSIAFDREQAFTLAFAGWSNGGPTSIQVGVPATADVPVTLNAAVLPGSRSVQVNATATVFATMIATGLLPAHNCRIEPAPISAGFAFWRTNPATNEVIGGLNSSVTIAAGGRETFLLAFTPTAPLAPTPVHINFHCDNAPNAPVVPGVNTLLLSADSAPVPDVVALVATLSNDGIVNVPGETGSGAFAVATVNVGAGARITARADTADAAIPVSLNLCRTDPGSGQCISDIGSSVTVDVATGQTPTFAVFVTGGGPVPFDPGRNRIFVRFEDDAGAIRGMTSVAVRTGP